MARNVSGIPLNMQLFEAAASVHKNSTQNRHRKTGGHINCKHHAIVNMHVEASWTFLDQTLCWVPSILAHGCPLSFWAGGHLQNHFCASVLQCSSSPPFLLLSLTVWPLLFFFLLFLHYSFLFLFILFFFCMFLCFSFLLSLFMLLLLFFFFSFLLFLLCFARVLLLALALALALALLLLLVVVVAVAVAVAVVVVVGCCWLLLVVVGCCWLLLVVVGCCWLLLVVVGCWLLVVVGCGWLWLVGWLVVVGCGWLWLVVVGWLVAWLLAWVGWLVGCCCCWLPSTQIHVGNLHPRLPQQHIRCNSLPLVRASCRPFPLQNTTYFGTCSTRLPSFFVSLNFRLLSIVTILQRVGLSPCKSISMIFCVWGIH